MASKKSIKQLHKTQRPREKLLKYGRAKLSNAELLAILLQSGNKKLNAIQLAKKLLGNFPKTSITKASATQLLKHPGIGKAKASSILAALELGKRLHQQNPKKALFSPKQIWEELKDIRDKKKEYFIAFYLNAQKQLISREIISIGCLDCSIVHPREVFEPAIKNHAASLIVAHNHPSGNLSPSSADLKITQRLQEAGSILGIEVLDHIIVTKNEWLSLTKKRPSKRKGASY